MSRRGSSLFTLHVWPPFHHFKSHGRMSLCKNCNYVRWTGSYLYLVVDYFSKLFNHNTIYSNSWTFIFFEQVAVSTNRTATSQIPNYPNLPPQLLCQVHNVTMHVCALRNISVNYPQNSMEVWLIFSLECFAVNRRIKRLMRFMPKWAFNLLTL